MTASSPTTFSLLLKRYRLAAGLTQEALAERAGLSARGVQDLERGLRVAPRAETVRLLADALGLDDQARSELIAATHPELAAPVVSSPFPPRSSTLPIPPTMLIGREREVASACALLRRTGGSEGARLLTLTGPGGVGKTRLSLAIASEIAADFADGRIWVDLSPISDPNLVAAAVGQALGIRETGDQPIAELLRSYVSERSLLLVLDNFEHVLPAAQLVGELLAAGPDLVVLATSRARLRLRGERELPVPPLAMPEATEGARSPLAGLAGVAAVRLFVDRAAEVRPGFALTPENATAVAAICRRVEGLPLALELAAARVKMLTPAALLARLEQRLPLLAGGARDLPLRQQTMHETIAWSYDLLAADEQALFRRLAVFVGGFSLEAAEAISYQLSAHGESADDMATGEHSSPLTLSPITHHPSPSSVLDLLAALFDQSLVRRSESRISHDEARCSMLETVREYALEQLTSQGEDEAVRHAHAALYLSLAERAEAELTGPARAGWLDRLEVEHDNLRAALAWAIAHDPPTAMRLVGALWRFWWLRGYLSEGSSWAEAALAREGGSAAERARAFHVAGDLAQEQGDYRRARPLLEAGLTAAQAAEEPAIAALCLSGLGFIARSQGAYEQAAVLHGEALALQREIGDQRAIACTLANLGSIAQNLRQAERAETLFAEALVTFRALGDQPLVADVSANLAILANQEGDYERAFALAEDALLTYRDLEDRQAVATALIALANAERGRGDPARAGTLYGEALDLFRGVDHKTGVTSAITHLASLSLAVGNVARALPLLTESLGVLRQTDDKPMIAAALESTARAAGVLGQWELAARLLGVAASLRGETGAPVPATEAAAHRQTISAATTALGEETYATMDAVGRALPLEHAIAEALMLVS